MNRVMQTLAGPLCLATAMSVGLPARAAEPSPPPPSAAVAQTCTTDAGTSSRRGNAMFGGGIALTATGAVVALLIGGPALLMRQNAREDANTATYETRQRFYARRANRRERVAIVSIGVGGAMMLAGIPLMLAGSRIKRMENASLAPVVTPTMAGMSARVRF